MKRDRDVEISGAKAAKMMKAEASHRREKAGLRLSAPEIIHADDEILVVDKPAGVLSVHGRGKHPILSELMKSLGLVPDSEPFRIVHRLDLEASGVFDTSATIDITEIGNAEAMAFARLQAALRRAP